MIFCCFTAMENFVINGRSIYVHFTEYSGEQNDKTYDDEIFGRAWWSNVHQGYLFNSDGLSLNPADFLSFYSLKLVEKNEKEAGNGPFQKRIT